MTKICVTLSGLALALTLSQGAMAQGTTKPAAESTQSEARIAPGHSKDTFFTENDTNKDGRVTAEEFAATRAAKYRTFDLNGDGKVTEEEYVAEFTARMHHGVPEGQLKQAHVRFGVLDTDKNGDLTLAEFNASGERMFERLDTNGDGVVDAADTTKSY